MFKHSKEHHHKLKHVMIMVVAVFFLILSVFFIFKIRNTVRQYGYIGRAPLGQYTVTVSGEGKVSGIPDIANINLGVTSESKTVKVAQESNTKKMNAIIAAVKDLGVKDEDMQTANYNIYPKYSYDRDRGTSEIVGYTVSQSVKVKVRDLDKVGNIISKAGDLGANQVGGIGFTIDDPESLKEKARELAIKNAKKKANALFKELGVSPGRIVSFSEYSPSNGIFPKVFAEGVGGGGAAPTVEAGILDVSVNVNLVFEIK